MTFLLPKRILKDYKLYEGLIHSVSLDDLELHLNKWATAYDKFIIKKVKNKVQLQFSKNPTESELYNLIKWINNLGWYIAAYTISNNSGHVENKYFKTKSVFVNDIQDSLLYVIQLEAKFDLEMDIYDLPEKVYHISLMHRENKISKMGLVPRTKKSTHIERIYFLLNKNKIYQLCEGFYKVSNGKNNKFIIYEVNIKSAHKENESMRFFQDPNLNESIYTLSNIHPKFLKIIDSITINNNN